MLIDNCKLISGAVRSNFTGDVFACCMRLQVPQTWHMVGRGVGRRQPIGGTYGRVVAPVPGRLASRAARLAAHPLHFTSLHTSHHASALNRGRDTTNVLDCRRPARAPPVTDFQSVTPRTPRVMPLPLPPC